MLICLNIIRSSAASSTEKSTRKMKNVVITAPLPMCEAAADVGIKS